MRPPVSILAAATLAFGSSPMALGQTPLAFFIVSPGKVEGGRFIDTSAFPNLGFISPTPQLEIRKLDAVIPGERKMGSTAKGSSFHIRMSPEDAKWFAVVTQQAVGKQLLIMIGDTLLMAPRVREAIAGPSLQLQLDETQDGASIGTALKALTN